MMVIVRWHESLVACDPVYIDLTHLTIAGRGKPEEVLLTCSRISMRKVEFLLDCSGSNEDARIRCGVTTCGEGIVRRSQRQAPKRCFGGRPPATILDNRSRVLMMHDLADLETMHLPSRPLLMLHARYNAGAVREVRGEEMGRRWALLASEIWDAERRAGEVPCA